MHTPLKNNGWREFGATYLVPDAIQVEYAPQQSQKYIEKFTKWTVENQPCTLPSSKVPDLSTNTKNELLAMFLQQLITYTFYSFLTTDGKAP